MGKLKQAQKLLISRLGQLSGKLKNTAKNITKGALKIALVAGGVSSLLYLSSRAPELHNLYLRYAVGSKVYLIQENPLSGGGTGFSVKAPSGISYIVTNDHVCRVTKTDTVLVTGQDGKAVPRRILERSNKSDLCLIEGMPNIEGLDVGDEFTAGSQVTIIGHPLLRPLTVSVGEKITTEDVKIIDFIFPTGNSLTDTMTGAEKKHDCTKPKNEIYDYQVPDWMGGGTVKFCLEVTKKASMTTAPILPGNSGSPVVDFYGNVVGVAFANDQSGWSYYVSNSDLKQLLEKY